MKCTNCDFESMIGFAFAYLDTRRMEPLCIPCFTKAINERKK